MPTLPRRPFLMGLGATALAAGPHAARAQTPPNALVIGHLAELQTLDPAQAITVSDFRIPSNMYDGLTRFRDASIEIEPGLATSWTVSPDGKTYTFKLRDGVLFHDGSRFDAQAVKFNFDRVLDKSHPYYHTGPFPFIFTLGPIVEETSRVSGMLSGETDLTIEVPADNVPELKQDKRFQYYEQQGPHLGPA